MNDRSRIYQHGPPPSLKGAIFVICILIAPYVGKLIFGPIGFVAGIWITAIGLIWFFFHFFLPIFRS